MRSPDLVHTQESMDLAATMTVAMGAAAIGSEAFGVPVLILGIIEKSGDFIGTGLSVTAMGAVFGGLTYYFNKRYERLQSTTGQQGSNPVE